MKELGINVLFWLCGFGLAWLIYTDEPSDPVDVVELRSEVTAYRMCMQAPGVCEMTKDDFVRYDRLRRRLDEHDEYFAEFQ